jgi:hypothetical protein
LFHARNSILHFHRFFHFKDFTPQMAKPVNGLGATKTGTSGRDCAAGLRMPPQVAAGS